MNEQDFTTVRWSQLVLLLPIHKTDLPFIASILAGSVSPIFLLNSVLSIMRSCWPFGLCAVEQTRKREEMADMRSTINCKRVRGSRILYIKRETLPWMCRISQQQIQCCSCLCSLQKSWPSDLDKSAFQIQATPSTTDTKPHDESNLQTCPPFPTAVSFCRADTQHKKLLESQLPQI